MSENMLKFLEAFRENEEMQKKVNIGEAESLVSAAKEMGFDVSAGDAEAFIAAAGVTELSDESLEGVAGGCSPSSDKMDYCSYCGRMAMLASNGQCYKCVISLLIAKYTGLEYR